MKPALLLSIVLFISSTTHLHSQNPTISNEAKIIKDEVQKEKLYNIEFRSSNILYPSAFLVEGDPESKEQIKFIKKLKSKSRFQWHTVNIPDKNYYIILPKILLDDFVNFYTSNKREITENYNLLKYFPNLFTPKYENYLFTKYNIYESNYQEFLEYKKYKKLEQVPIDFNNNNQVTNISSQEKYNIDLPIRNLISRKIYPYYGNVSIKILDSENKYIDSYGYIYDKESSLKPWGEEVFKEFKATVTTNKTKKIYEVYCDKNKMATVQYTNTSTITNYEGQGLLNILFAIAGSAYDKSQLNDYEEELYRMALQKTCFYKADLTKKNTNFANILFKKAKISYELNEYLAAIQKTEESLWIEENSESFELRGDIHNKFNYLPDAISDYLRAIELVQLKSNDTTRLALLYRKIAIPLALLKNQAKQESNEFFITINGDPSVKTEPEIALDYIRKAAKYGDSVAIELIKEQPLNTTLLNAISLLK